MASSCGALVCCALVARLPILCSSGSTNAPRMMSISASAASATSTTCHSESTAPISSWWWLMSPRTSSPIIKNTPPSSTSVTARQMLPSDTRCSARKTRSFLRPITTPATTAATSPEPWSRSVGTEAAKGMTRDRTVETVGSCTILRAQRPTLPAIMPITMATNTE